jgi:VIT1/CCC1 family predicted Fe2+/Mn2+ transporter
MRSREPPFVRLRLTRRNGPGYDSSPSESFTILKNVTLALRVSKAIAIVLLFLTGYAFGRVTGRRPVRVGIAMVVLGAILVVLTMALGG